MKAIVSHSFLALNYCIYQINYYKQHSIQRLKIMRNDYFHSYAFFKIK